MTREEKRICAERLFDEIGLIDDRFITEAASPYAPRKRVGLRRLLVAAASIPLTVCIGVGIFAVGKLGQDKSGDAAPENGNADNILSDTVTELSTLSDRLCALRADTEELKVSEKEIQLFGGSPSVIWKYSDEDSYRVSPITDGEVERLSRLLEKDKGQRADVENAERQLDGVWIATGDGRVISPYLEQTDGNTGYGEIFEYSPEYEPSEEFSEYLCDIIS